MKLEALLRVKITIPEVEEVGEGSDLTGEYQHNGSDVEHENGQLFVAFLLDDKLPGVDECPNEEGQVNGRLGNAHPRLHLKLFRVHLNRSGVCALLLANNDATSCQDHLL